MRYYFWFGIIKMSLILEWTRFFLVLPSPMHKEMDNMLMSSIWILFFKLGCVFVSFRQCHAVTAGLSVLKE